MRGTSIGSIRVYVVANETSARKAIWQVGGEQGEAWFQAEIAIPSTYYENQKKFHVSEFCDVTVFCQFLNKALYITNDQKACQISFGKKGLNIFCN